MRDRPPVLLSACLAAMSLGAAPALATGSPPLAPAPTTSALPAAAGSCTDNTPPSSGFTANAARRATHTRILVGTARDAGCGVALVTISVSRRHGTKCQFLSSGGRLTSATSCAADHWLSLAGTKHWRVAFDRLPRGMYRVRTRAFDRAGNAQHVHGHRLRLS